MSAAKKTIIIGDSSSSLLEEILAHGKAKEFAIFVANDGKNCLELVEKHPPDLVIVEFMLPKAHGIEVLQKVRKKPSLKNTGVILTDYHCLPQNYNSSTISKLNYLLPKPFKIDELFALIEDFFKGGLSPKPLQDEYDRKPLAPPPVPKQAPCYLKFWGTRGSYPAPGNAFKKFGGDTCCLEVRSQEDLVIIDAGTGMRSLGQSLINSKKKQIPVVLGHTHWDHLLGFPFFYPLHQKEKEIKAFVPVGFDKSAKEVFKDILDYTYFPVSYDDIEAQLLLEDIRDGEELSFGSITLFTHYAFHPGATLCFKIHIGDKVIGYVTDNEFLQGNFSQDPTIEHDEELFTPYASLIEFFTGCDLLVHEAQYSLEEYEERVGWGHSSTYNAALLIKKANISHWITTHHDPRHTDEDLEKKKQEHEKILQELQHTCKIDFAFDGMVFPLS